MTLKNARIYQELLRRLHHAEGAHPRPAQTQNTLAFARSTETRILERPRRALDERAWLGRK